MQLPLWAYLFASAAAITAITLMLRRLETGSPPPMTENQALALFREAHLHVTCTSAEATPDGKTFFVTTANGDLAGCVTLIGIRWTTRNINARDVTGISVDGSRTRISFADFEWPTLTVDWGDPHTAQQREAGFLQMWTARHA